MNFDEKQTTIASQSASASAKKDVQKEMSDDEKIDLVASRILKLYRPAFEELAK